MALREQLSRNVRRGYHPAGVTRQLVAIIASGDRRRLLRKIRTPTLVIHGAEDPLVPVEAGRDTARHIAGARLMVIDGMGHDLPPGLLPILVEAIAAHCHESEGPRVREQAVGRPRRPDGGESKMARAIPSGVD